MQQEVLKETLAAPVLLRADMLRLASSSSESTQRAKKNHNLNRVWSVSYPPKKYFIPSHLSDCIRQGLDDLFVRRGNDALPIDFNDAVPNTDASSLCYTAPHQTADLQYEKRNFLNFKIKGHNYCHYMPLHYNTCGKTTQNTTTNNVGWVQTRVNSDTVKIWILTYNAVLHTEAQLILGIWPPDNRHGDRRTVDDAELHILLAFQVLRQKQNVNKSNKLRGFVQNDRSVFLICCVWLWALFFFLTISWKFLTDHG